PARLKLKLHRLKPDGISICEPSCQAEIETPSAEARWYPEPAESSVGRMAWLFSLQLTGFVVSITRKLPRESFVAPVPRPGSADAGCSGCVKPITTAVSLILILTT